MAAEFDFLTRSMPDLSPELLAAILAAEISGDGSAPQRWANDFHQLGQYRSIGGGDAEQIDRTPGGAVWGVINSPTLDNAGNLPGSGNWNGNETNYYAQYDPQGRFIGYALGKDNNSWRDEIIAATMILGGYFGGNYLSEAAAGGATGTGLSGMDLAADAAVGTGNNIGTAGSALSGSTAAGGLSGMDMAADAGMGSVNSGGGTTWGGQAATSAGTSAATKAGTSAATTAATNSGTAGNAAADGIDWAKLVSGGGDWGNVLGGLLGAYAGYQSGKDKEDTRKTEPWAPMQPYLLGLAEGGRDIYNQQMQQPFSQAEKTAYSNLGNSYDFINANAPGLLSGFQATGQGKNQFSRDNPRRGLIGFDLNQETSPVQWMPGLLGSFGTAPPVSQTPPRRWAL